MTELYNNLVRDGKFTGSLEEFLNKYGSEEGASKLHSAMLGNGDYTKSFDEFKTQFNVAAPQPVSAGTQSASEGTSSEPAPQISWFDQTWLGRGIAAASTTGEASDLLAEGSNVNLETVQEFIKAKEDEAKRYVASERMNKFQKKYEAEGKTWSAFFRGLKRDPALMAELFVQSLGTQIGTAMDSEQAVAAAAAGAGVGAGAGAAVGASGAAFTAGISVAGGAVTGAISGAMGGLATAMETTLTFGELIETELEKEGKEFTDVNIKALLEGPKGQSIRNRSLGRGITIGAFEALSGGVAGKVTTGTIRGVSKAVKTAGRGAKVAGRGAKVAGAVAGLGVEGVGGGLGEVAGRVVAGQEMDAAEIGFEAVTGGAVGPITVAQALISHKDAVYKLNGEKVTYAQMKDFVETADDIDVATADIKMENDFTGIGKLATKKQNKARIDSQIDSKITDKADRDQLMNLDVERRQAKADTEKTGIEAVPGAQEKLDAVEKKISDIIGKYEGATDIAATEEAAGVRKAIRENKLSETIAFAKAAGKQIGKDVKVVDNDKDAQSAFDAMREEHNAKPENADNLIAEEDVTGSDGFISGDTIFINKDVAGQTGAISVGSHEVLHGVLAKHMQSLDTNGKKKLISSFKGVLSKKQLGAVTKRLQDNYQDQIQADPDFLETTDEWFTAFSDAIEKNEITFDEGIFSKLKNTIQEVLRKFGIKKEFADGRAVYNFMKEYSKNVKEGKLGKRATALAGGGVTSTEFQASRSKAVEAVNAVERRIKNTVVESEQEYTKQAFQQSRGFDNVLDSIIEDGGAINSYVKAVVKSPKERKKAIKILGERLLNYDPQAQRKTDSTEPVTIGEFLMANKDFARLVAKKELAIESQEQAMTTSMDTQDQYGRTISETIAETTEEAVVETKKQQKQRILTSLAEVTLDNKKIINLKTQLKIADLIEQNPPNLEEQLTKLVEKDVTKSVQKEMGDIKFDSKNDEVIISDEYKAFMAFNYENIIKGLDVTTIKNNYKTLFELTKIGVEEKRTKKADKPSLKKDSNFRKAVFLIETNKAKFTKFFTDTTSDVQPQSHYNKLRARQKGLAKLVAEAIVKDAINTEIIETSTNVDAVIEAKLRDFANSLDRQKSEVLGNYNDQIKYSKTKVKNALDLKSTIESGETVFDNNGKLLPKYKKKYTEEVGDFVYKELYTAGLLQDVNDLAFIGKSFRKLVKAGKRGIQYEAFLIDQLIVLEKKYGKDVIEVTMTEPSEAGGLPDVQIKIHGQLFNIEAKMTNAQYSSVTFAILDGKFGIKKDYTFNDALMEGLAKPAQEKINKFKAHLKKKYDVDWELGMPLLNEHYSDFKEIIGTTLASMEIDLDIVSEIYNKKANYPVSTIQLMGRGLFHMGDGPNPLNLPKLKGKATVNLRVIPNSQYKTVDKVRSKTGKKVLTFRAIPIIPKATLETLTSDKSIGNAARIDALLQSKEAAAMEVQAKASRSRTTVNAIKVARSVSSMSEAKGISVLDFDDTLATTKSNVLYTMPDGTEGTLNAEEFAEQGSALLEEGAKFDFSEFNKVVEGKTAPLFNKALKLAEKFGTDNMYILTARSPGAQAAIKQFLDANGLNLPAKNIVGLGKSEASAKAEWIAGKVGEGFNDFYFADDAIQNVKAVKNMLEQFDVKSKVQQARLQFSKSMNQEFNNMMEEITGIEAEKRFSLAKGRKRGKSKGKFRVFIPPSHEDFAGLLYNFMGKGRLGDKHRAFWEKALIKPLNRGMRELDLAKQSIASDFKELNKIFPDVKKKLKKTVPNGDFTFEDAVRAYLWDKNGHDIPGLSETDRQALVDEVMADPELRAYADSIQAISKQPDYTKPTDGWEAGNLRTDLDDATGRSGRETYLAEFTENFNEIFSEENLNKIEAEFGRGVREAIEDMAYRIKTGKNRPSGNNALVNKFVNFINGAVGGVMFFNIRSAVLQQMSIVNFLNFADNNIFAAAKAFADQKQFWSDFSYIFNSPEMKQRRGGIQTDVNGAELAASISGSKNPVRKAIAELLRIGFTPTQIGDSFAIAIGGAPYYRNRVKTYQKQGMSKVEAEARAWEDFQEIAQATQQSARPDMVSQQQASPLGKFILAFQNVTSQFNRLGKKAFLDIKNRRITPPNSTQLQSDISNSSRILYYLAVQNIVFYSLQTAVFAMMFDDDEDDEKLLKKKGYIINGSIDSVLRGTGVFGAVLATLKNMGIKFAEQREAGYNKDESAVLLEMLNVSPPIGIKARQIVNAEKTLNYEKDAIEEMETFDIDNPVWSAVANIITSTTNIPTSQVYRNIQNTRSALDSRYETWQRALMFMGWSKYNIGADDVEQSDTKGQGSKKKNEHGKPVNSGRSSSRGGSRGGSR